MFFAGHLYWPAFDYTSVPKKLQTQCIHYMFCKHNVDFNAYSHTTKNNSIARHHHLPAFSEAFNHISDFSVVMEIAQLSIHDLSM